MGAHSTLTVSRDAAIRRLQEIDWNKQSNYRIGQVLDALFYESLHNFLVEDKGDTFDSTVLERILRIVDEDEED